MSTSQMNHAYSNRQFRPFDYSDDSRPFRAAQYREALRVALDNKHEVTAFGYPVPAGPVTLGVHLTGSGRWGGVY